MNILLWHTVQLSKDEQRFVNGHSRTEISDKRKVSLELCCLRLLLLHGCDEIVACTSFLAPRIPFSWWAEFDQQVNNFLPSIGSMRVRRVWPLLVVYMFGSLNNLSPTVLVLLLMRCSHCMFHELLIDNVFLHNRFVSMLSLQTVDKRHGALMCRMSLITN